MGSEGLRMSGRSGARLVRIGLCWSLNLPLALAGRPDCGSPERAETSRRLLETRGLTSALALDQPPFAAVLARVDEAQQQPLIDIVARFWRDTQAHLVQEQCAALPGDLLDRAASGTTAGLEAELDTSLFLLAEAYSNDMKAAVSAQQSAFPDIPLGALFASLAPDALTDVMALRSTIGLIQRWGELLRAEPIRVAVLEPGKPQPLVALFRGSASAGASSLPTTDRWNHELLARVDDHLVALISPGRDGRVDWQPGPPVPPSRLDEVDHEIVWRDGYFVSYPGLRAPTRPPTMPSTDAPPPQGIVPPQRITAPAATYPLLQQMLGIAGRVELRAHVDELGAVTAVDVISATPGFAETAIQAVPTWRYMPAMYKEKPVAAVVNELLTFTPKR